jgi:hypothetical protein
VDNYNRPHRPSGTSTKSTTKVGIIMKKIHCGFGGGLGGGSGQLTVLLNTAIIIL